MILPELGGRVQMAYDKIAKCHQQYGATLLWLALINLVV